MNTWKKRNCPICDQNSHSEAPEMASPRRAENLSWEQVKDLFVGLREEQSFFSYYRCLNCGLLYCPWYFSDEQLEVLYSEMPDNLMGEDKSVISKTQSGYVKWLAKRTSGRNYMEIGPDIGLVANSVDSTFSIDNSYLVEPNRAVHPELSKSMPKSAEVKVVEYLNQVENAKSDLITGIHVYDHLLYPVRDLVELRSKSSMGASLIIVVHNEKSPLRYLMKKAWPPFCLQHPQLYNPETLGKLLKKSGWQLEEVKKSTNWYKARHFVEMGLGVLGLPKWISKIFPSVEVPLKLGNMISISKAE